MSSHANAPIEPIEPAESIEPERPPNKPMLTIAQQIDHFQARGITFDHCSEEEAAQYLRTHTYYYKIAAYRSLFPKRIGGAHDGEYANLDFAYLRDLDRLDHQLRQLLLPMTLDVEHYAKVRLMRSIEDREPDGYAIIQDYFDALTDYNRMYRMREIERLRSDLYMGDLIRKYPTDRMPVWVFFEVVSFGALIDFYLFCANRWHDRVMKEEHYLLRQAKAVRNATAHSSDIINGFADNRSRIRTTAKINAAITNIGVSKTMRNSKMRNPRIQQIVMLMYVHRSLVKDDRAAQRLAHDAKQLSNMIRDTERWVLNNDLIRSTFTFLRIIFDKWFAFW